MSPPATGACSQCLNAAGAGDRLGRCWAVCRCDERYPSQLFDIEDPPSVLYGLGAEAAVGRLQLGATVTIVGSRRASPYGLEVARELGRLLGAAGLMVVSGMAFGIDSAAHEGALEGGGTTVAVLGGGADVAYPPSKRGLHRRIAASDGAVISERPPGTEPERWSFPARNRIMAALAAMTVVVEAAEPSGSLITADVAGRIGRMVGAVPGPVRSRTSAGTNALIRGAGAALIRDAQDVLDEMLGVGRVSARSLGAALDDELAAALDLVESGHASVDALARARGGPPQDSAVTLARLELLGYVAGSGDATFVRTALEPPG